LTEVQPAQENLLNAVIFATKKHQGQKRKGKNQDPYIFHPLNVAKVIMEIGQIVDQGIVIAAILHDTLEDTTATRKELARCFGQKVTDIVDEVTDNKKLDKNERKRLQVVHAPSLSYEARVVKLGDKLVNCRDILSSPPAGWSKKRMRNYIQWAFDVIAQIRGTNAQLEDAFDTLVIQAEKQLDFSIQPFDTIDQRKWAP
jgi:guanosine-3',5'-bis(diphosphate) 3'-pyrophosphohydrolase